MSSIQSTAKISYTTTAKVNSKNEDVKQVDTQGKTGASQDVFVKSLPSTGSVTYSKNVGKSNVDSERIDALLAEQEQRQTQFKEWIMSMITKQGEKSNCTIMGVELTVTPEQSLEAQKSIGEDGEWGVNAVATRILDMAKAFVGNDSSKFSMIKQAVLDGYAAAEEAWGGELPEICGQTLDEINARFDAWEKELFGEEE